MKIYPMFSCKYIGITQYFSESHKAIDLANTVTIDNGKGTNEYAYIVCDNAKVIQNSKVDDYGWFVEYETTAPNGDKYVFASGHFSEKSPLVVGQTYNRGEIAGKIGSTGYSDAPHDHFRVSINGTRVNPLEVCYVYNGFNIIGAKEKVKIMLYDNVPEPTPEPTPTQKKELVGTVELYNEEGMKYKYPSTKNKTVEVLDTVEINGEKYLKIYYEDFNPNIVYIEDESSIPSIELKVGDIVEIIGGYASSAYSTTAKNTYAKGMKRQIKSIIEDKNVNYPYMIGNASGITGFAKESSLKKI